MANLQGRSSRDIDRKCSGATRLARFFRTAHARAITARAPKITRRDRIITYRVFLSIFIIFLLSSRIIDGIIIFFFFFFFSILESIQTLILIVILILILILMRCLAPSFGLNFTIVRERYVHNSKLEYKKATEIRDGAIKFNAVVRKFA